VGLIFGQMEYITGLVATTVLRVPDFDLTIKD
jgi:hypothetical protein